MGTVEVRNSVAKRVIVTLMPAISFLCMFGLAAISVNFLEYGSTADRIVGYIGVSCIIPMIVSIPFIFKVNREKTVLDINTFYVTPFVGRTKNIPVQDVKVCTIGRRKQIRLFDEKSNLICKYKSTQDKEQIILKTLQKAGTCTFTFSVRNGKQVVVKGSDRIFTDYLATGEVSKTINSYKSLYYVPQTSSVSDKKQEQDSQFDQNIKKQIEKNRKIFQIAQIVSLIIFLRGMFMLAFNTPGGTSGKLAVIFFFGGVIGMLLSKYLCRRKEFEITKPTFYRVEGTAVNEKDFAFRSSDSDRHLIYEFQDKYGVKHQRPSDKVNASDTAWGLGVGEKKILWYSPFVPYLLDQEPLEFKMFMDRRRLTPGEWIKRHPILTVGCIAFIVWIGFRGYKFGKAQIFIYTHDGRNLKTEWTARDAVTDEQTNTAVEAAGMEREELEKWLKQSFYPYFYVISTSFGEFDAFDVENYADVMGEDKVEAIRENISDYWGIHDRKSLMKTTDSLLQKGDKYTYAQTLEKLGDEALTLPEDSIYYTYKLYAPDEMCKYLGTYYAYNNIGDAGVDAWDYCRCIRLFAFGYICGYISYDEYLIHAAPLAVYLQNEYDSWETMYESYYYGYLIFAGRNKNSSSSVIYSDYRYYEIMADKTEIPFRTEER